jgi:hypothetical protein
MQPKSSNRRIDARSQPNASRIASNAASQASLRDRARNSLSVNRYSVSTPLWAETSNRPLCAIASSLASIETRGAKVFWSLARLVDATVTAVSPDDVQATLGLAA